MKAALPDPGGLALLRQPSIPVAVLTGFLGSGKTTLIRSLLRDPAFEGTAVVVNEFGEVGLDHILVEAAEKEDTILLDGAVFAAPPGATSCAPCARCWTAGNGPSCPPIGG